MSRSLPILMSVLFALTVIQPAITRVEAAPVAPSAPLGLVVSSGPGPGEVFLQWLPPAQDGGSPITAYRIYRGQTSGQLAADALLQPPALAYTDGCVGHGRTWYYQVAAINSAGEGGRSGEASGISGIPPSVGDSVVQLGGRLPYERSGAAGVWTGTVAYVLGGNVPAADAIVRYDPALDCATDTEASLPAPLHYVSALWDGQFAYLFGGRNTQLDLASDDIIRYDPSINAALPQIQALPSAREATTAVLAAGQHLVIGGYVEDILEEGETTEVFNAKTGQTDGTLPEPRMHAASVWTGSQVLVFGGTNNRVPEEDIYAYDPVAKTSTRKDAELPHMGIEGAAAAWDGTHAYVAGGWGTDDELLNEIQRYDPASGGGPHTVPTLGARLPWGVAYAASAWDGRHLYLFGGERANDYTDAILRFTPSLPTERDAPQNLQASRGPDPGQISLSWQEPANAAGLTGYRIYRGLTPAAVIRLADTGNVLSFVDTGLAEGVLRCYKVTALYGSTESRISGDTCQKAPERPAAPLPPLAKSGASVGEIDVSWQPPLDNGGIAVSAYRVYRDGAFLQETTNLSLLDAGLAPWVPYAYTVSAVNAVGEGAKSVSSTSYAASTPSMPRSIMASNVALGKMKITWLAPATDGGKPITNYRIYRTEPDGVERWIEELPAVLTYTDTYLVQGAYSYRVTGVNEHGEGQSSPIKGSFSRALPARPQVACVPGASPGTIDLAWSIEHDGGSSLFGSYLYRSDQAGNSGSLVKAFYAGERSYSDRPVTPGVNYYYRVEAKNGIGTIPSFEVKCFLPPPPAPGTPPPTFCGILDTADLDEDGEPDCRDEDIDGDHLANDLEKNHLEYDPRDDDLDDDGLKDYEDPVPTAKGFAAAVEIAKICNIPETDGSIGWAARADLWVDSEATMRTNALTPPDSLALEFYKLREDNHFHNEACIDQYGELPSENVRDSVALPDLSLDSWQWHEAGIPQIKIELPFRDHDANNCEIDDRHNCAENAGENNPSIGMPDVMTTWSILQMRVPGTVGVDASALDSDRPLTVNANIWKGNDKELEVFLRVNINASGCDLLTALLGKGVTDGEILDLDHFIEFEDQVGGDVCESV